MALKLSVKQLIFVSLDLAVFVILSSTIYIFYKHLKPFRRGFFCTDESIRKPYKDSTIPASVAVSVGLGCNFFIVMCTEIVKFLRRNKEENDFSNVLREARHFACGRFCYCDCPLVLLKRICKIIFVFLFGAAVTGFLTDVMKYSVGRLRPHFLDVCKPNWMAFNCTDPSGGLLFVTEYTCLGKNEFKLKDSRLSFPSGHASFSAYAMVFAIIYVGYEMKSPEHSTFLKPILQLMFACLALVTGLSRISDYKHHWSDVLAGFILGLVVALFTTRQLQRSYWNLLRNCANENSNGTVKLTEMNENDKLFAQEGV